MWSFVVLLSSAAAAAASGSVPKGGISVPLIRESNYVAYLAEFQVGTPPQKEYLVVDTGSSTISFENPKNDICSEPSKPCAEYGTFVNTSSSTCKYVSGGFSDDLIDFGSGDVLRDNVKLGGTSIKNLTFGYLDGYAFADQVAVPTKTICGFALQCSHGKLDASCYGGEFHLLPQLYKLGYINRRAVSFYFGPEAQHVNNSEMIIGGFYDKAKQGGNPFTLPMVNNPDFSMTDFVNVSAISSTIGGNVTRLELTPNNVTLVDTGNPFFGIPNPIWHHVSTALGGLKKENSDGGYVVDCKYRKLPSSEKISVEFGSSQNVIDVPLASLVINYGNNTCGADINSNGDSSNGIGPLADPFLRNAYITFDADDFAVTMAQVKYTTERNIQPLPK